MYWPVLLTSQHNLHVCCVLKLQWCIYSYVPRSPLLQERGHLQLSLSSLWIIVQLVHVQYCIVMHVPLHCYRRVVISSCDWDKASCSLRVLFHQN